MAVVTVDTETSFATRSWTGVEPIFVAGFKAEAAADVLVFSRDALGVDSQLTAGVHHQVTLASDGAVTVTPIALPAPPKTILILRDTPALQGVVFKNLASYSADAHQILHSRAAMRDAEDQFHRDRAVLAPMGEQLVDLPRAADRAGKVLGFDGTGQPIATVGGGGGGGITDGDKGDIVVSSGGTVWTIDANTVTNGKLADMASPRFKARLTAGNGDPEDITGTQATTMLDAFTSTLKGLAPPSAGGTVNFLRADGTWVAPPGGSGVTDGDKGDITVSAGGATWTIDADVVSNAKLANMATASFKGRTTAGTGDPEDLTVGQAAALLAGTAATNLQPLDATLTALAAFASPGLVTRSGVDVFTGRTITGTAGSVSVTNGDGVSGNPTIVLDATLAALATFNTTGFLVQTAPDTFAGRTLTGAVNQITITDGAGSSGNPNIAIADADHGDIVVSGSGLVWTIDLNTVTNTKLADMTAPAFKARITGGAGDPEDINGTQATSMLDLFTSGLKGLAPASGGGTVNFLRADATWQAPPMVIPDGDKGDIVVSAGGTVWTIDVNAVTNAKLADVASPSFKGRITASVGDPEELTPAQATSLLDVFTSTLKGLAPASGGGTSAFLRADGTWQTPPGGGGGLADAFTVITDGTTPASATGAGTFKLRAASPLTVVTQNNDVTHGDNALLALADGDRGDITVSSAGTIWTIDANAVTNAQLADMDAATVRGRAAGAGTGDPVDLTGAQVLAIIELATPLVSTAEGNAAYQPLDLTLNALAAFNTNGLITQTAADTFTGRTITGTANQIIVSNGNGVAGNPTLSLDATLAALGTFNSNGLLTQTAADTFTGRTITGTASEIEISNGDGVAGNPVIGLPNDVVITTSLTLANAGLHLLDTNASHDLVIQPGSDLTADRILTIITGDAARSLTINGNTTLNGSNTGDQTITLTGDVTGSGSGSFAATIANDAVSNAKLANMTAPAFKARVTAGAGDPEDITGTQATTMLDVFTSGLKGLAPLSGGGTVNFLRADGTWVAPPGGSGVADGDKGDITVSVGGTVWTIDAGAVTNAKLADVASPSFKGRITASAGVPEDLTGTQATTLLDLFTTGLKGLAPASGGGTANFLRADGTWNAPTASVADGDKGDITVSSGGTVWTIDANAVTNAELADVPTATFKGRTTAATGDPEDLTLTQAATLLAGTAATQLQPRDATLTALAAFNTNGLLTQTAADTFAGRTITGTASQIAVANGDGVAGNPALSLPSDVVITTSLTLANQGLHLLDINASHDLVIQPGSDLTADRILTIITGDAARSLTINGTTVLNGTNTGDQTITLTGNVTGSGTGSFATTIAVNAVANTQLADMATATIKGRVTAATGDPEDLTATQARTVLGLATTATVAEATVAEYRANTADRILGTDIVWGAAALVTLADAATVAVDMATFINATVTLAGNRALGNPTNPKVGQSGFIEVRQDATGTRTLSYGANWEFAGAVAPVLSTAANSSDVLFYTVLSATRIVAWLHKAVA